LHGVQAYILNNQLELCGIGESGELYIGGKSISQGYINNPKETAQAYLPNPFSRLGERLYKTGDLARYLTDGRIQYLGRVDHQVKVRGYRVELSEIEYAICQNDIIKQAVVIQNNSKPEVLTAFCVLNNTSTETEMETALEKLNLTSRLRSILPSYMVPQKYVALPRIPVSRSGKIDRQFLNAYQSSNSFNRDIISPRHEIDKEFLEIWKDLLEVDDISIRDNFFELGGNSINAAVFVNKVQKKLNAPVFVMSLFDQPSIERYSDFIIKEYPEQINTTWQDFTIAASQNETEEDPLTGEHIAKMDKIMRPPIELSSIVLSKNINKLKSAVFILAPSRSGSTLLRIILARHPALFSPPELELLNFTSMSQRLSILSGRSSYAREGLVRAYMDLLNIDTDNAIDHITQLENNDSPIWKVYEDIQKILGDQILVDKTPTYCMSLDALKMAEIYFDSAKYIHLIRHPYAVIKSYLDNRLDLVRGDKYPFSKRQQAELTWLISHRNITEFLNSIPNERKTEIYFESLVSSPKAKIKKLCEFLGIEYTSQLLNIYQGDRMTDGLYTESRMQGDIKFHSHQEIDHKSAENWKNYDSSTELCKLSRQFADRFNYKL
jgi:hypothetical protein